MEEISHTGRIVDIDRYITRVEIIRHDACSACHARELCGYSSDEHKIVSVPTDGFAMHSVGDEVELCMKKSMGMKAVWISYVIPLVLLIAAVLVLSALKTGELTTGLGGITVVALYYILLFFMKGKLENQFEFYIKKI